MLGDQRDWFGFEAGGDDLVSQVTYQPKSRQRTGEDNQPAPDRFRDPRG
jgi:hypothetical protein